MQVGVHGGQCIMLGDKYLKGVMEKEGHILCI